MHKHRTGTQPWRRILRPLRRKVSLLLFGADSVERHWARRVMNLEIDAYLESLSPESCLAVEISGSFHRDRHEWMAFRELSYPEFDLCNPPPITDMYDVVICEQVLEHVENPGRAVDTLRSITRPGGHVVISTPFLLRVHPSPGDYWRFTPDGLRILLSSRGLEVSHAAGWGNRACAKANLPRWAYYRWWRSLRNDSRFPVSVWAFAKRPLLRADAPEPLLLGME